MVGVYWLTNIAMSAAEAAVALAALLVYLRLGVKIKSRTAAALTLLAGSLVAHALLSIAASVKMMAAGEGPEVAIPLIPQSAMGLAAALTLLYITTR